MVKDTLHPIPDFSKTHPTCPRMLPEMGQPQLLCETWAKASSSSQGRIPAQKVRFLPRSHSAGICLRFFFPDLTDLFFPDLLPSSRQENLGTAVKLFIPRLQRSSNKLPNSKWIWRAFAGYSRDCWYSNLRYFQMINPFLDHHKFQNWEKKSLLSPTVLAESPFDYSWFEHKRFCWWFCGNLFCFPFFSPWIKIKLNFIHPHALEGKIPSSLFHSAATSNYSFLGPCVRNHILSLWNIETTGESDFQLSSTSDLNELGAYWLAELEGKKYSLKNFWHSFILLLSNPRDIQEHLELQILT